MDQIHWTTETRKVKDLVAYKDNPRQISKEQLAQLKQSLEKFDYAELIAVQPDGTIIAGHMRVKAMLQLGWGNREILVRVPTQALSIDDMREYLIRSNKNVGEWDWDILANSWDPEDLHDWGFTENDLDILINDTNEKEYDESIIENSDFMIRYSIKINQEESASFENQLDALLEKFPNAIKEKKI